jgi:hypothetical protein
LLSCLRLPVQYIRTYPPYLEAFFFISNPRTHLAVMSDRDPLKMDLKLGPEKNKILARTLFQRLVLSSSSGNKVWVD